MSDQDSYEERRSLSLVTDYFAEAIKLRLSENVRSGTNKIDDTCKLTDMNLVCRCRVLAKSLSLANMIVVTEEVFIDLAIAVMFLWWRLKTKNENYRTDKT